MKTSLLMAACALALGAAPPGASTLPPGGGPAVLPLPGPTPPGPVPGGAGTEAEEPLTAQRIFRDNFVGDARVEFTVRGVSILGPPLVLEEAGSRVPTADGSFSLSRLQVVVSEKVEARLRQLGIEDPREHFFNKTVRVSGNVKQEVNAGGVGGRLITYRLAVEHLDQLECVGKPTAAHTPGAGGSVPSKPGGSSVTGPGGR